MGYIDPDDQEDELFWKNIHLGFACKIISCSFPGSENLIRVLLSKGKQIGFVIFAIEQPNRLFYNHRRLFVNS